MSVIVSPGRCEIMSASSSHVSIGCPFKATIRSRGWTPASAAGMPGCTSPTTGGKYGAVPMLQTCVGSPNGVLASTRRGDTTTSRRSPARTIVSLRGRPPERTTRSSSSPQWSIGRPSTATTSSTGLSSAWAAGESGSTRPTVVGYTGTPAAAKTREKITAARAKFIPGPAKTMRIRAQSGFRANDLAGSTPGASVPGWITSSPWASSPVIFT